MQNLQIIIQGKRQIRFAAAKIQDRHFPVFWKLFPDILDKFQEAVDLPEFVIFGMDDLSIRSHDSQIYQKRHRRAFFQNITLFPVMA